MLIKCHSSPVPHFTPQEVISFLPNVLQELRKIHIVPIFIKLHFPETSVVLTLLGERQETKDSSVCCQGKKSPTIISFSIGRRKRVRSFARLSLFSSVCFLTVQGIVTGRKLCAFVECDRPSCICIALDVLYVFRFLTHEKIHIVIDEFSHESFDSDCKVNVF